MSVTQLRGGTFCGNGVIGKDFGTRTIDKQFMNCESKNVIKFHNLSSLNRKEFKSGTVTRCCASNSKQNISDYISLNPSSVSKRLGSDKTCAVAKEIFDENESPVINQSQRLQSVQSELIWLSLPAIAGQAIEPLAQLMETAYIGRLGPIELASAGVSISIFNILSKVFNIPLLSVATSFVAEDISRNADNISASGKTPYNDNDSNESADRKLLPSVSTALILALGIGSFEALAMYLGSGFFIQIMGVTSASPMYLPAKHFLVLRAIGAPAVVLSLAIQGIFRGFKDTKTPVLCLGLGNLSAVFLLPLLMYYCRLGVTGAAISTVLSQYVVTFLMIWFLNKKTILSIPNLENLHFGNYLKSGQCFSILSSLYFLIDFNRAYNNCLGGFLLGRTLAAVMTITLSTSMAARQGPLAMAAHQICLQVWLSVSLLADAQAASGQALIASYFAKGDYGTVKHITYFALKMGLFTGVSLAIILGVGFNSLASLFTNNIEVLHIIRSGSLFVSASQPITAVAYIFDGLHNGISDFSYAAYAMIIVGAISSGFLLYAPSSIGLYGVWSGLALFMGLRVVAGFIRLLSRNGPWKFLQEDRLHP
ncbi:hypothetical protein ACFE04_026333 [Oxalis oulophora]